MARKNPKMNFVRNSIVAHDGEDRIYENVISIDEAVDLLDDEQIYRLCTGTVNYISVGENEYITYIDATNLLRL
jgi:hypothetical protein